MIGVFFRVAKKLILQKVVRLVLMIYICKQIIKVKLLQPLKDRYNMSKNNLLYKTFRLYVDGFRSMTIGKVLWTVILIKLFVMFFVLKLFFFPDVLGQKAAGDKASYVAGELTGARVEQ